MAKIRGMCYTTVRIRPGIWPGEGADRAIVCAEGRIEILWRRSRQEYENNIYYP